MNKKHLYIILLFAMLPYSNTLFNGFVWDDNAFFKDRSISPGRLSDVFSPSYWKNIPRDERGRFRPLRSLAFLLDGKLYGEKPAGYHLTNVALHASASALVYKTALALSMEAHPAFFAAALFAAYPAHAENVSWVKNRSDILCSIFFMLSMLFFLEFVKKNNPGLLALSLAAFFLSALSKEYAVTLPLVLAARLLLLPYGEDEKRRGFYGLSVFFALAALWYLSKEFWWNREMFPVLRADDAYTISRRVIPTLNEYFRLLFLPYGLAVEKELPLYASPVLSFGAGWLLMALAFSYSIYSKRRDLLFFCVFSVLTVLPVSNFVFLESRPLSDGRLYIPGIGAALFCGVVFNELKLKYGRSVPYAGLALLVFFSAYIFARNSGWKDENSFYRMVLKNSPSNYRANFNLGALAQKEKDCASAVKYYEKAAEGSDRPEIYYSLGFCYDMTGKPELSIKNYLRALAIAENPPPDLYNNAGIVYEKTGDLKSAEKYYKKALELSPGFEPAVKNLENLGKNGGKKAAAGRRN